MDLDSLFASFGKLYTLVKPHGPFFLYMFIFAFIGEVSKRKLFTKTNIKAMEKTADKLWNQGKSSRILSVFVLIFARTPFEFHPMVAGLILGLFPGIPMSKGVGYGIPTMLYCMFAGIMSLAFYDLLHAVYKVWWKYVLRKDDPPPDIYLPGEEPDNQP